MSKNIKKIYSEICLGYSQDTWKNCNVYIKHFGSLDLIEIDSFHNKILEETKAKGIKTQEQKLEWLIQNKLWSKSKDIEINSQKDFVDNLEKTNEKLIFKSQKIQNEKILQEERHKLNLLENERDSLIGLTAERIASQKIQFYYIYSAFFKNAQLSEKYFSLEDMDNLDEDESFELLSVFLENNKDFAVSNIKKIAISRFFSNNFDLCGDNLQFFFGKPIYLLTNYQSSLLSYGSNFKNIFASNPDLPDHLRDDPEKIEEFVIKGQNFKQMMGKIDNNAQSVGIVANDADFKEMGLQRDTQFYNSAGPTREK